MYGIIPLMHAIYEQVWVIAKAYVEALGAVVYIGSYNYVFIHQRNACAIFFCAFRDFFQVTVKVMNRTYADGTR